MGNATTTKKRGPVTDAPAPAERAHEVQEQIKTGCAAIRTLWVALAGYLYEFFGKRMWKELGYETFTEWLATPEIDLGRTQVYALVEAYRELVVERGVDPEQLGLIDVTKIAVVLPAIRSGEVDLAEALADCESMSRSDLREKYGQQLPEKTGGGGESKGRRELVQCEQCGRMREPDAEPCEPIEGQEELGV